jgi:hypothetical protein
MYCMKFVFQFLRCTKLRYFSSAGPYFFIKDDWRTLCRRSFPDMANVHVEEPEIPAEALSPEVYAPRRVSSDGSGEPPARHET